MIRTKLLILLLLGFTFQEIYGQNQSETFRKNQIDFFLGGSSIKSCMMALPWNGHRSSIRKNINIIRSIFGY